MLCPSVTVAIFLCCGHYSLGLIPDVAEFNIFEVCIVCLAIVVVLLLITEIVRDFSSRSDLILKQFIKVNGLRYCNCGVFNCLSDDRLLSRSRLRLRYIHFLGALVCCRHPMGVVPVA